MSGWVFTVKKEQNGERFKARLVAKGFTQTHGIDFADTFAPVMKMDSFRFVLAYAAVHKWKLRQLDAKNAFLNGEIDYDVYMKPPDGVQTKPGHVWKLLKGVYGLKQAPKLWYETIRQVLQSSNYKNSFKDSCIFYKRNCMLVVYVDDILIAGATIVEIEEATKCLSRSFCMKDLGTPNVFLGMTLEITQDFIKLTSKDTIERMVSNLNIELPEKELETPFPRCWDLSAEKSRILSFEEKDEYKTMIGMLLYVSNTVRFDIGFHVSRLASYTNSPKEIHYRAAKRVLQYLGQTKQKGIKLMSDGRTVVKCKEFQFLDSTKNILIHQYNSETRNKLTIFSDADWGNSENRRSQSGGLITFCGNIISWLSKKQSSVALSTAESELMAIREISKSGLYFYQLLNEIGIKVTHVNLCGDNKSALTLSMHNTQNNKTRHIDISYFFIRELVEARLFRLWYIQSELNPADLLTKNLNPTAFNNKLKMMLC